MICKNRISKKDIFEQTYKDIYWCSLVEAKGPLISMDFFRLVLFFVSIHNFACTKGPFIYRMIHFGGEGGSAILSRSIRGQRGGGSNR